MDNSSPRVRPLDARSLVASLRAYADMDAFRDRHTFESAAKMLDELAAQLADLRGENEKLKDAFGAARSLIADLRGALKHENEKLKEWKEAIIDACVVDWILTSEHETNPRKAVNDLLCWQQKIALDPAVSKDAHDLHERADKAESDLAAWRSRGLALVHEWQMRASRALGNASLHARGTPAFDLYMAVCESYKACADALADLLRDTK